MIRSMTGYGRGEYVEGSQKCVVEIKSVNHRFLELSVKVSKTSIEIKTILQNRIKGWFTRGYFEVVINFEGDSPLVKTLDFDEGVVKSLLAMAEKLKVNYNIPGNIDINTLLKMEGVITSKEDEKAKVSTFGMIEAATEKALAAISEMKVTEGKMLSNDMEFRISVIRKYVQEITDIYPDLLIQHRENFKKRLKDLLADNELDDMRVIGEAAIIAERSDITEELVRLDSHIKQFLGILLKEPPVGKPLEFILQEMNRETNTIGAKVISAKVTEIVVAIKAELERVREQIQNVE